MNKRAIIIVLLVIALVVGVWLLKYMQKHQEEQRQDTADTSNPDFQFNITSTIDIEKLKSYNLPIIIDFGADYCMPCREMHPTLKKLNKELQEKAIIRYVDIVRYPKIANEYPVDLIPTQLMYKSDGTPYEPENAEEKGYQFIKNESGEHLYTIHVGLLTETELRTVLKELGANE